MCVVDRATMARVLSDLFPDRLLDYFLIVGCHCNTIQATESIIQNPKLLKRYPSVDHPDFVLPPDIVFFCQPEGCLCTTTSPGDVDDLARTFFFMLTDKETNKRRHGVCLNFFRNLKVENPDSDASGIIYSLTSVCIVTHHAFFVPFVDAVTTFRQLVEKIACSSLHFQDGPDRVGVDEWDDFLGPSASLKAQELEGWIQKLLRTPVPEPGVVRLELELAVKPALTLAYPDKSRLFLVDFPAYLVIELLGIDQMVNVLSAVIMEQKVTLMSVDYQTVSVCVMALLVYMYPLEYVYPVIPLLPTSMPQAETILQTPAPFLVGVPASFFHPRRGVECPNDVTLVDLDTGEVQFASCIPDLPPIPEHALLTLKADLNKALNNLHSSPESCTSPDSSGNSADRVRRLSSHGRISPSYQDAVAIDIKIRIAFIQFFTSPDLLGELRFYLRTLRLHPRPVIAQQKRFFLKRIERSLKEKDSKFVERLCSTQSVDCFGEWFHLYSQNSAISKIVDEGIIEPYHLGDKPKYFASLLNPYPVSLYESSSSLGQAMLELKAQDPNECLDECSTSYGTSSSSMSSVSTLYEGNSFGYRVRSFGATPSDTPGDTPEPDSQASPIPFEKTSGYHPGALALVDVELTSDGSFSPTASQSHDGEEYGQIADSESADEEVKDILSNRKRKDGTACQLKTEMIKLTKSHSLTEKSPEVEKRKSIQSRRTSDPNQPRIVLSGEAKPPLLLHSFSKPAMTPDKEALPRLPMAAIPRHSRRLSSVSSTYSADRYIIRAMRESASQKIEKKWQLAYDVESGSTRPSSDLHRSLSSAFERSPFAAARLSSGSSMRADSPVPAESEEQRECKQFVSETVTSALKGSRIGFFAERRLQRLLSDERLRLVVVARIFEVAKQADRAEVTDVWVAKSVHRSLLTLLKCCTIGLESSIDSGSSSGIASAFSLLEIAYTFFTGRESILMESSSRPGSIDEIGSASPPPLSHQTTINGGSPNVVIRSVRSQSSVDAQSIQSAPPTSDQSPFSINSDPEPTSSGSLSPIDAKSLTLPRANQKSGTRRRSIPKIILDPAIPLKLSKDLDALLDQEHSVGQSRFVKQRTGLASVDWQKKQHLAYLFKNLLGKGRSTLWDKAFFWEALFFDTVAAERSAAGLEEKPGQLIERFSMASLVERKKMEEQEDGILCGVLHNMVAFMLALKMDKDEIRRRTNRFVGQAHLGLQHTEVIYNLLDSIKRMEGNCVELQPLCGRQQSRKEFLVHIGVSLSSPSAILVICDSCVVVKTIKGPLLDRYWYENIIKLNFHPGSNQLIMWHRKLDNDTVQRTFSTQKCRELYNCLREKVHSSVLAQVPSTLSLEEGFSKEYSVRDLKNGEGGVLTVTSLGIECRFVESTLFIDLYNIKDCGSQNEIFEVQEDDGEESVSHRFASSQCSEICQDVLRVFSLVSAQSSNQQLPEAE